MNKFLCLTVLLANSQLSAMDKAVVLEAHAAEVKLSSNDQKFVNDFVQNAFEGNLDEINAMKTLKPDLMAFIDLRDSGGRGRTALFAAIDGFYWGSGGHSCREVFDTLLADGADTKQLWKDRTLQQFIQAGLEHALQKTEAPYHTEYRQYAQEWIAYISRAEKARGVKATSVDKIQQATANQSIAISKQVDARTILRQYRANRAAEEAKKKSLAADASKEPEVMADFEETQRMIKKALEPSTELNVGATNLAHDSTSLDKAGEAFEPNENPLFPKIDSLTVQMHESQAIVTAHYEVGYCKGKLAAISSTIEQMAKLYAAAEGKDVALVGVPTIKPLNFLRQFQITIQQNEEQAKAELRRAEQVLDQVLAKATK